MPSAILAIALAVVVAELSRLRLLARLRVLAWAGAGALAALATSELRSNVSAWVDEGPREHAVLIDDLRALASGAETTPSTVFVSNLPASIALFDGFNLRYIEDYVWPTSGVQLIPIGIPEIEHTRVGLSDDERLLIFDPSSGGCVAERNSGTEPWPSFLVRVSLDNDKTTAGEVVVASFGPYADGLMGTVIVETNGSGGLRLRLDIPWFPSQYTEWFEVSDDEQIEFAMLTNLSESSYEFFVNGDSKWLVPTDYLAESGESRHVDVTPHTSAQPGHGLTIDEHALSPCTTGK
jgi:hypothetical protein